MVFDKFKKEGEKESLRTFGKNVYMEDGLKRLKQAIKKKTNADSAEPSVFKSSGKPLYIHIMFDICENILRRASKGDAEKDLQIINSLSKVYDNYFTLKGLQNNKVIDNKLLKTKQNTNNLDSELKMKFNDALTKRLEKKVNTKVIENNEIFQGAFYDIENAKKYIANENVESTIYINRLNLFKNKVELESKIFLKEQNNIFKYVIKLINFIVKGIKIIYLYVQNSFETKQKLLDILINKKQKVSYQVMLNPTNFMSFSYKARRDLKNTKFLKFDEDTYYLKKNKSFYFENPIKLSLDTFIFFVPEVNYRIERIANKKYEHFRDYLNYIKKLNILKRDLTFEKMTSYDIENSLHKLNGDLYKIMLLKQKDEALLKKVNGIKAPLRISKMYKRLVEFYNHERAHLVEKEMLANTKFEPITMFSPLETTNFKWFDILKNMFKKFSIRKVVFAKERKEETKEQKQKREEEALPQKPQSASETKEQKQQRVENTLKKLKENAVSELDLEYIRNFLEREIKPIEERIQKVRDSYVSDKRHYKAVKNSYIYNLYRGEKKNLKKFLKLSLNKKQAESTKNTFDCAQVEGIEMEMDQQINFINNTSNFNKINLLLNYINIKLPLKGGLKTKEFEKRFQDSLMKNASKRMLYDIYTKLIERESKKKKIPLYKRIFGYIFQKAGFNYKTYPLYHKIRRLVIRYKNMKRTLLKNKERKGFEKTYKLGLNNNYPLTNYKYGPTYVKSYNDYVHLEDNYEMSNLKKYLNDIIFNKIIKQKEYKYDFINHFYKKALGENTIEVSKLQQGSSNKEYKGGKDKVKVQYKIKTKPFDILQHKPNKKHIESYVKTYNLLLYSLQDKILELDETDDHLLETIETVIYFRCYEKVS